MSLDAFIMPAAPPPPANNVKRTPVGGPATSTLDRPAQSADRKESFLATLNRVSEHTPRGHDRSHAGDTQTSETTRPQTESASSVVTGRKVDPDPVEDQAGPSTEFTSTQHSPLVCDPPVIDVIHTYLMKMFLTDANAGGGAGASDSSSDSTDAALKQLLGLFPPQGPTLVAGRVGIESFEPLQADISPDANNLSYVKQRVNRAIVQQLAAEPSGRQAALPFFEFWRSLTATPAAGAGLGGQAASLATRLDEFVNHLFQRYEQPSPGTHLSAATVEANGKQTILTEGTLKAPEDLLLHKMAGAVKSAEAQPYQTTQTVASEKDVPLFVGTSKQQNVETLLEPRHPKYTENSQAASPQPVLKEVAPAVSTSLAAQSMAAKSTEQVLNFKTGALQNDILSVHQTNSKVVQIDGEAKDSSFFASQENLPEHLTKLEHTGRSAAGAQNSLASQTMNQIVQKAILFHNNGQNTVQIDLKPDFLGHIRMQIVTESQQVAVRIVAEFPMVKEMLESNLNQLKAELQAQGLEVDELEVSLAHDSRADDDPYQKATEARRARASKNNRLTADTAAEGQSDAQATHGRSKTETAIDFFA
jgi:flagellar hook-length control protein FliK